MLRVTEEYKALAEELLKKSETVSERLSFLSENLGDVRPARAKNEIIKLLKDTETISLKARSFIDCIESDADEKADDPARAHIGRLEVYPGNAYLFVLPPLKSFRKKAETTGLGKLMRSEVLGLVAEYRESGNKVEVIENPVVHFVHHVRKETAAEGYLPDPDNLEASKIIDALQDTFVIKNDNILSLTLVHEGLLSESDETYVYVYEKGNQEAFLRYKPTTILG